VNKIETAAREIRITTTTQVNARGANETRLYTPTKKHRWRIIAHKIKNLDTKVMSSLMEGGFFTILKIAYFSTQKFTKKKYSTK